MLKNLITSSDTEVKKYLIECFQDILKDNVMQEAILGNLFYEEQELRFNKIIDKLKQICQSI